MIVQVVFHHSLSAKTAAATYALAKKLEARKGFTVLKPTPFYDTDVLAVTERDREEVRAEVDRRPEEGAGRFKLGGLPECQTRNTCLVGYTKTYGLTKATFVAARRASRRTRRSTPGGARSRRVLDRPAARHGLEVHRARPTRSTSRLPERRADRARRRWRRLPDRVHEDRERRLGKLTLPAIIAMNKAVIVDKSRPGRSPARSSRRTVLT